MSINGTIRYIFSSHKKVNTRHLSIRIDNTDGNLIVFAEYADHCYFNNILLFLIQTLITEETSPPVLAVAIERLFTGPVLTTWIFDALVTKSPLIPHPTSEKNH